MVSKPKLLAAIEVSPLGNAVIFGVIEPASVVGPEFNLNVPELSAGE